MQIRLQKYLNLTNAGYSRRQFLYAAASLLGTSFLFGQDEPTFSTDVKVVSLLATVVNKKPGPKPSAISLASPIFR